MPETKRPLKIFLCHAHVDSASVRALYDRLTKDGVDAWPDKGILLPGWDLDTATPVHLPVGELEICKAV